MSNKKAHRKYLTEFSLNIYSTEPMIIAPSDLDKISDEKKDIKEHVKNSNIYLILKRPRISFIPNSIYIKNREITGKIGIQTEQELLERNFKINGVLPENVEHIKVSNYPHTKLTLLDKNNEDLLTFPVLAMLKQMNLDLAGLEHLKVEYVGQAFGSSGERSAAERLASHSTLQKILADIVANQPNMEVFLALYRFEFHRFIYSMDGTVDVRIDGKKDREHYKKALESKFKRKMRISLAEAALIRYFQPKYNKIYKKEFPKKRHKILKKLYDFDFAALAVEASVEDLGMQLYSNAIAHSEHHIARFDLHNIKERKSFFFSEP
jgi:hypothetical protein